MTGYNKVFVDTTPLIYFLDDDNYNKLSSFVQDNFNLTKIGHTESELNLSDDSPQFYLNIDTTKENLTSSDLFLQQYQHLIHLIYQMQLNILVFFPILSFFVQLRFLTLF